MKLSRIILGILIVLGTIAIAIALGRLPPAPVPADWASVDPAALEASPLRIGLVPVEDVFAQRRRFEALAAYLSARLERPVVLATPTSRGGILEDFEEQRIDAAFLGSLAAVQAMDRYGAAPLSRPTLLDGRHLCRGVIFVRDDSPHASMQDLGGASFAMVRATMAGHLFPAFELDRHGVLASTAPPEVQWSVTFDAAIHAVAAGRVTAGAADERELQAFERAHAGVRFRRISVSRTVPGCALVARRELDTVLASRLREVLLAMHEHEEGRATLAAFGAAEFRHSDPSEYDEIRAMLEGVGPEWEPPRQTGAAATPSPPERSDPA